MNSSPLFKGFPLVFKKTDHNRFFERISRKRGLIAFFLPSERERRGDTGVDPNGARLDQKIGGRGRLKFMPAVLLACRKARRHARKKPALWVKRSLKTLGPFPFLPVQLRLEGSAAA